MWNPLLAESQSPPRRATRERGKGREKRDKENKEDALKDLTAFGYECFLFRNDELVAAIEAGQYLIPWQSQDPAHEDTLWLDRYDARNLLDDQRYFTGPRQMHDNTLAGLETEYDLDQERYADLDSDEEIMFDMDEYQREEYLEEKRSAVYRLDRRGIGFSYDDAPKVVTPFKLHFSVPEGMATPEDAKSMALIERTAKFINNCSEPTMEATLQVKQAGNPSFGFLTRRHPLHALYKHVRWLMQTGAYEYEEDIRKKEEEEAKAALDAEQAKSGLSTSTAEATTAIEENGPPHQDVQQIVDTTARYVAKHGPSFEERIRREKDERFCFLDRAHPWYSYYSRKLDESKQRPPCVEQPSPTKGLTASDNDNDADEGKQLADTVSTAEPCGIDPSALFMNYLEQEESASQSSRQKNEADTASSSEISSSNPNTSSSPNRALEMRLERMQRIRELLQKKQGPPFPEP